MVPPAAAMAAWMPATGVRAASCSRWADGGACDSPPAASAKSAPRNVGRRTGLPRLPEAAAMPPG